MQSEFAGGSFNEVGVISCDSTNQHGVSCLVFDPEEELLWASTFEGRVSSYYGANLEKYTSFLAHTEPVRQLLPLQAGVVSISPSELRMTARTGLQCFTHIIHKDCDKNFRDSKKINDLQCMVSDQDVSKILIGCQDNKLVSFDLPKVAIIKEEVTESSPTVLRQSDTFTCVGTTAGSLLLLDPNSLKQQYSIHRHSAGVTDMVVIGNYIATCSFPLNMFNQLSHDEQLAVYDVRALRSLHPLSTMCHPIILRHVPSMGSTLLAVSQAGEFQFLHLGGLVTPTTMHLHQVNTQGLPCCAADVSLSGQFLAFGDSGGFIHNWSNSTASNDEDIVFNTYSHPTVFPDQVEPAPYMDFNDPELGAPLSAAPLTIIPRVSSLLSDWPAKNSKYVLRQPEPIPSDILDNMKMVQFVGYAPKPAGLHCNQCPYQLSKYHNSNKKTEPESPMMRAENPLSVVPKPYRRVEIVYSKMGIEGFDFQHYNKTSFAGLEIHIPNAYCNAMLQVLYFLEPIRCSLRNHVCLREFCLSCELNFLFRMLDQCQGENCQASNFLRTFRTLREALALGLVMSDLKCQADLRKIIQQWTSFVLQQLHQEILSSKSSSITSVIQDMFATHVEIESVCRCGKHISRATSEMNFPLIYPSSPSPLQPLSFAVLVQQSLCRRQQTHMWCDECGRYRPAKENRQITNLPRTLCLTCQIDSEEAHRFWAAYSNTLPLSLSMQIKEEGLSILEETYKEDQDTCSSTPKKSAVYDLVSIVGHVNDTTLDGSDDNNDNLVAHIRVAPSYHLRKEDNGYTQWYLFNDFAVQPISQLEAATIDHKWFTPCVLMFAQHGVNSLFPEDALKISYQLDSTVLTSDRLNRTASNVTQSPLTFTPLQIHEGFLSRGDIVAIDAEFVTLNQEEAELRSDGTHLTVKPSQLSVARVTVVRGEGTLEGTPFIDDYISTSEQVVDYLTRFSGIKPGDLDAHMSSKHLTTLKETYLKLLYLVDAGVSFVGHGLKKDFRVINIKVPANQILDTVELFHLPNHRYISLKYLAWFFLGMTIQGGSHDSVEDARTALMLYRKHQQLTAKGDLATKLRELYDAGREHQWKIPGQ